MDVSVNLQGEQVTILERGRVEPKPVAPKKLTLMVFSGIFGIILGILLAFLIEYLDDSIRFPEEVEEGLGIPFFGMVPAAGWDQKDVRSHLLTELDPKAGLSEAYRTIRSAILFNVPGGEPKIIAVTSSIPKEGKTTTSTNLAITFAQGGANTLLVDADLRRGGIHKAFGIDNSKGFSDVLAGEVKPEIILKRSAVKNLDILPCGPYPDNPADQLLGKEMDEFIEWASKNYDKVIFDCPPVMAVSDAGVITGKADATIMVVWAGQTSRRLALASKAVMETRGAKIVGCILNNLEFGRVGYYYYATYYNYYDYGYRYDQQGDRPEDQEVQPLQKV